MMSHRWTSIALVLIILMSGCVAIPSSQSSAETATEATPSSSTLTETATPAQSPASNEYPDPPSELTDDAVAEVALEYQKVWLGNQLENESGLESFGTGGAAPKDATILNRSDGGVYVDVRYPYWYDTGEAEADVPSRVTYFVTETTIRRVNGTDVDV